jgi:hypothetical protein
VRIAARDCTPHSALPKRRVILDLCKLAHRLTNIPPFMLIDKWEVMLTS